MSHLTSSSPFQSIHPPKLVQHGKFGPQKLRPPLTAQDYAGIGLLSLLSCHCVSIDAERLLRNSPVCNPIWQSMSAEMFRHLYLDHHKGRRGPGYLEIVAQTGRSKTNPVVTSTSEHWLNGFLFGLRYFGKYILVHLAI